MHLHHLAAAFVLGFFFFLLFSIKLNTLLNNNASPQQAGHGMIGNKSSIYTILRILVGLFEFTGKVESGITRQFRFVGRLTSSESIGSSSLFRFLFRSRQLSVDWIR